MTLFSTMRMFKPREYDAAIIDDELVELLGIGYDSQEKLLELNVRFFFERYTSKQTQIIDEENPFGSFSYAREYTNNYQKIRGELWKYKGVKPECFCNLLNSEKILESVVAQLGKSAEINSEEGNICLVDRISNH